ncbi:MAG: hypothetical protein OXU23_11150 [Candidatus Poribacteria bacterium]|nr:hypothetical protein [Candidatus Poribacteria bacterium]
MDLLTDEEKAEYRQAIAEKRLHEGNIPEFIDRFLRAPNRENAFNQAFNTGFGASAARESMDIKRIFADPPRCIEVLKNHYLKHGMVNGTLRIALSPVTIPVRSWSEVVGGQPGLGEYPLKILIGAASVLLWGVLIMSKRSKQTKYNYKAALSRLAVVIPIIFFIIYSLIDGAVSGLTFVLYAGLFWGTQYLIIRWILYYIILWTYRSVILWIYRGLKG